MSESPISWPILEYDPNPHAIVEPQPSLPAAPVPKRAVMCFFQEVLEGLRAQRRLRVIGQLKSEIGPNPLYLLEEEENEPVLVLHPGVGAPLAAGFLEEIIALGVRKVMVCGGCGALTPKITAGHVIVVTAAVRDEGTSYHYLPPAREVIADPQAVAALVAALEYHKVPYRLGKTWTTDGLYRETVTRRARRVAEGCLVVEMEAAALMAVARFRGVPLGQVLYGGDLVIPEGWDRREWYRRGSDRERLFWLTVEAVRRL
ncbi:MAG: nucleoside phosphorylase [Thermanaerothrix sp.]|uniref:nucleoside phosphorylase n=1 Tax=Thermanaerothrix sp. TaxID=2972675 RepID=UPI003C7E337B